MTTISKSAHALHMAHYLFKHRAEIKPNSAKQVPQNWKDCIKLGWYFVHIRKWLKGGIVTFSFWKKDGTVREAKATLHPLLIPIDKQPKTNDQRPPTNYQCIPFFDLDKQEWRSFAITHFIGFVTIYQLRQPTS